MNKNRAITIINLLLIFVSHIQPGLFKIHQSDQLPKSDLPSHCSSSSESEWPEPSESSEDSEDEKSDVFDAKEGSKREKIYKKPKVYRQYHHKKFEKGN